jgi:hypothetical protein
MHFASSLKDSCDVKALFKSQMDHPTRACIEHGAHAKRQQYSQLFTESQCGMSFVHQADGADPCSTNHARFVLVRRVCVPVRRRVPHR